MQKPWIYPGKFAIKSEKRREKMENLERQTINTVEAEPTAILNSLPLITLNWISLKWIR